MSSTEQRTAANRANALKSTGPTSTDGKNTVSRNAIRHGLFSNRLFLDDEDAAEFDQLQLELQTSLNPVGAVELALVERVAINMWRQRRLVTAETATIRLARKPIEIADAVNKQLRLGYASELKEHDLQPFDGEHARWCQSVMEEIDGLEQIDLAALDKMRRLPSFSWRATPRTTERTR